jgi:Fatty acid desaturase
VTAPAIGVALGVWWVSNTVAHLCIHRAFFRRRRANQMFAAIMSIASGIPQALWRDRHLAHHAGVAPRLRLSGELALHVALVAAAWGVMLEWSPAFFIGSYLPGYVAGLLLCAVHGHYEHARGTTSHYGRLYNLLTFNDGFHVEHHANPSLPWRQLPALRNPAVVGSAWPAPLRWLEAVNLEDVTIERRGRKERKGKERSSFCGLRGLCVLSWADGLLQFAVHYRSDVLLEALERLVLRSPFLQRLVLRTHERALRALLEMLPPVHRVAIVGGGLYPRTTLILRSLLPAASLTVIDANRTNLELARAWMGKTSGKASLAFVHASYPGLPVMLPDFDLVIFPLSFRGDRAAIYAGPPASAVIVHDWLWRPRGASRIVSVALLKRVNLVGREFQIPNS